MKVLRKYHEIAPSKGDKCRRHCSTRPLAYAKLPSREV
jgi:hypothetical protein